MYNNDKLLHLL